MKVAFVSTMEGCSWGGSEMLWSRTARRMTEAGHAVVASVRRWPTTPAPIDELAACGCRVIFRSPPSMSRRIGRALGLGRGSEWKWLGRFRPDFAVVSLGIHLEGIEAAAACRACGVPYALLVQSADENRWPGDEYLDQLRESYVGARRCFFVSQRNLELLETMLAVPLPNARVVSNAFNVTYDRIPPWPDESTGFRFACVGALAPVAKGQDMLFAALARPEWRDRPVRLSLFGNGQNEKSLRMQVERLKLTQVDFRGFVDDIDAVWAAHHVLVLPSRHEGMPLAVLEAMLCGRVCIVTDVAGNAEHVEDGVTGFLAAGPTPPLVRDAMERAWARRTEWREIGARAALAARAKIPADPVGEFVKELERSFETPRIGSTTS
jgi:glycosyltransferase involved in cell wall biosynthesis